MEITQCLVTGLPQTDGVSASWIWAVVAILVIGAIAVFSRRRIATLLVGVLAIGTVSFVAAPGQASADPAVCTASISGMALTDTNGDGIRNDAEGGLGGVTVQLQAADGRVLLSKTVDASGAYAFENLPAGSYRVAFVASDSGLELTDALVGDSATDSDADAGGLTRLLELADGQAKTHIDAGFRRVTQPTPSASSSPSTATASPSTSSSASPSTSSSPSTSASSTPNDPGTATIGNYVWLDNYYMGTAPPDGVQGADDEPLPGVLITLYAEDGTTVLDTTVSDAAGAYQFTGLPAGTYYIGAPTSIYVEPFDRYLIEPYLGSDAELDSDIINFTGKSAAITLAAGQVNNSIDIGYWVGP